RVQQGILPSYQRAASHSPSVVRLLDLLVKRWPAGKCSEPGCGMDSDRIEGYYPLGDARAQIDTSDGDAMKRDIEFLPPKMFWAGISGGQAVRPLHATAAPTSCSHRFRATEASRSNTQRVFGAGRASGLSRSSGQAVRFFAFAAFAIAVLHCLAVAQDKTAKIGALMSEYHQKGQFNGTVLVAEKGSVIFKKGYGM